MGSRYRSRIKETYTEGTFMPWVATPPITDRRPQYCPKETCYDTVGQRDQDNPFDLLRFTTRVPGLFGKQVYGGTVYREVDNWPIGFCNVLSDPRTYYSPVSSAELNNYAWATVSNTNPSRSNCNIPTMIGELKDVPDLVRKWGKGLMRKAANANLWWQFGVRPLISDVKKLYQFTKEVNNLIRAMRKLRDEGSITRRTVLSQEMSDEILEHDGYLNSLCSYVVMGQRYVSYTSKVWGSCRWKPAADFSIPRSNEALEIEMRRIAGGATIGGSAVTFWELVPWSWLADWFLDIQGFLGTIESIPLEQSGICIMRTTTSKSRYVHDLGLCGYNVDVHIEGLHYERAVRKERFPTSISGAPTASIPSLSKGQWSILGSLAVLKGKKAGRLFQ